MNKNNRLIKFVIAAMLAVLMAGSATQMLLSAMGAPCGAVNAYLPATAVAVLCGIGGLSAAAGVGAGIAAAAMGGALLMFNLDGLLAVRDWIASMANPDAAVDAAAIARAGSFVSVAMSALLAACLYACISRPGAAPLALLIFFAIMIGSYAVSESMSFGMAVPGLIAALAALALSGEIPRDAGAWRALIPVSLIVALALLLVPNQGLTWEPLANAAQAVRDVFEDYFRFTHERIPFTINTEGYNHAAEIDGEISSQLGGPANPVTEPVMTVTSDADVLLRGAIRRNYTGHSWEDSGAKARYLYYDFTRGRVREHVFSMHDNEAFDEVNVSVNFLRQGTSSLFVPTRLEAFSMDMQNALYYNSIGEIFLSRQVEKGDGYSLTGYRVIDEAAVRQAVIDAMDDKDGDYEDILATCLQLPDGIEEGVYSLAMELTANADNPYDKAAAIQYWLQSNCVYTLEPEYPRYDRDFVSQFVMDTREGYCSYFASAMTVMCRIAGIPARYVEGYSVKAGQDVTITGEDAHAWTEVYFNGIGWVSFDPGNGAGGDDNGFDDGDTADREDSEPEPTATPEPTPTPTPEPEGATPPPQDDQPTATPEPTFEPDEMDATEPPPWSTDAPQPDKPERSLAWLWILLVILLILLLLALVALWVRMRLSATDPIRLAAKVNAQQAAMVLYRSILTLLAQTGLSPMNGETPGAFARRVNAQTKNPDFIAFADAVAVSAYSRVGADMQTVESGRRAYAAFEKGLKKSERMRFILTRLFQGLGEFESIP